jgi:hypothetical protein
VDIEADSGSEDCTGKLTDIRSGKQVEVEVEVRLGV